MKKFFKNKKLIIIIFSILLILISFLLIYLLLLNNKKNPVKTKEEVKKPVVEQEEKKKLTIVSEDSNKRPIAVMIDNNVGNNSHAGLQDAYISYEIIVEGGLSRIMALFKDKDVSLIGPVRSSRHYFLDYALESDAIYTHYGWSTYAENDIRALGVNNINGLYDDAFWRDRTLYSPHNVFTSTEKLYSYAESKGYSTKTDNWKLLDYTTDAIKLEENASLSSQSLVANKVSLRYSYYQTRSYTYDNVRGVYLRYMNDVAHIEKTTGEQLYYKNIIIQKVANMTLDSYGRQDLNTTGDGEGYYITNGYLLPITWTKLTRTAKTIYKYSDGSNVKINDGNTFIQITPSNYDITVE